jgi:general secretion pathway protein A
MYRSFYGLHERPFDLTSDSRYLYLTVKHREALNMLRYGLLSRKGLALLIGEAGTGKTTLVRAALGEARGQAGSSVVYLSNPTLTRGEFVEYLAAGFGLEEHAGQSKTRLLMAMERHLIECQQRGEMAALVVDEAQSLSHELLEEVRLLANMETATEKLLSVVLAGQPELASRLNEGSLRQLKQRIAFRCVLDPLDVAETAAYIARRISVAGGVPQDLFSREAVEEIHQRSGGVPRAISVICDNALVTGFAHHEKPVTVRTVREVCRDFEFGADPLDSPDAALPLAVDSIQQADGAPAERRAQLRSEPSRRHPEPAPRPLFNRLGRLFHF